MPWHVSSHSAECNSIQQRWVRDLAAGREGGMSRASAGGMEDPAHFDTLSSQGIVLGHSLLRLQHQHVNPVLLQIVHSGCWNLGREKKSEKQVSDSIPLKLKEFQKTRY